MGVVGRVLGLVAVVVVVSSLAWVVLRGREVLRKRAQNHLADLIAQFNASTERREGYVHVRFPIYVGTVITATELQSEFWLPRANAKAAINSLALFSLKHGLVTIFAPYVLFMVLLNYVLHLPKVLSKRS